MLHEDVLKLLMPLDLGGQDLVDRKVTGRALDRVTDTASRMLANIYPATVVEMLPAWEHSMGIVSDPAASTGRRIAQIQGRYAGRGDLTARGFVNLAKDLGYEIDVLEPIPLMAGYGAAGDELIGPWAWWTWIVTVYSGRTAKYSCCAGQASSGDPLDDFGQSLEDTIRDLKPSDTDVFFTYQEEE